MKKYTREELAREDIVVKCDTQEQADYIVAWAGNGVDAQYKIPDNIYFKCYNTLSSDFCKECQFGSETEIIDFSEQFPEYEQEVSESTPEPIPTEYAVLTNATESAKKQIAEFEQALAQIKIDAMQLGSRDLARLIKALKAI